jgi:catechol 2,3-dioxygenase-like lactoylglutathione lyase family enzyme
MNAKKITPVIRIFDVAKAKEFYVDWLGFKIENEHAFADNFPIYIMVSLGSIVIHLSEHHGDCSPGAKIIIWVDGLKEFQTKLLSKKYKYYQPSIEKAFWGNALVMTVSDPFGNRIEFTEQLD